MPLPAVMVLAGGRATRMGGGDKALVPLAGATLLDEVLRRLAGQGSRIVINANGDPGRFARFGLPVLPDTLPDHPGPLAGILAGLLWVASIHGPDARMVSVPTDCPFVPLDLVARLLAPGADLALASSGGRLHPVVGLWPVRLASALQTALVDEGLRRVDRFTGRHDPAVVAFEAGRDGIDPFLNVNDRDELARVEASMAASRR